jgi:hypothetical protein
VLKEENVTASLVTAGRDKDPWDSLSPQDKAMALRLLAQTEVARALPRVLP